MGPDCGVVAARSWPGDWPRPALQDAEAAMVSGRRTQNLLLIGSSEATRAMVLSLMPSLATQVVNWDRHTPDLPNDTVGTLIVRGVARLTKDRQLRLFEWLNQQSRTVRVIATSTQPFFERVKSGRFLDDLYYRLNTVTILLELPLDTRRLIA